MNPLFDAFLRSWPSSPWLCFTLAAAASIYVRGWLRLRRHDSQRWSGLRLAAFLGGLGAVYLALASPIEVFADLLLSVHMVQHMLLMMVAPPLVWLGNPLLPLLRGLPRVIRSGVALPILRAPLARDVFHALAHPLVAWPIFAGAVWIWHAPPSYQLALAEPTWHVIEHATFLAASLLFWYPVVQPYPSRPHWSRWLVLPYLVFADVQNTVLSAWLSFAAEPIYRHYTEVPGIGGWTPLADQQLAGVLMWVPGSVAFLLPVFVIGIRMLGGRSTMAPQRPRNAEGPPFLPTLPILQVAPAGCRVAAAHQRAQPWDLLQMPVIGLLLRWRWTRPALQTSMFVAALLVMLDGFTGPEVGPANLAGVAPWIHWRGLVMLGLLVGGNFFCMACPFTLPRRAAARWLPSGRAWPRSLRSKWLAVALLAVFLWAYEAFSLWDSPWLTAWIVLTYFAAAFVVDGLFRDAAFCKYVCPIGQFNFAQSLVSPLEVRVREPQVCLSCQTKDCIRGNETACGCGTHLFQPRKLGNFDCTFCLDCVQACPHENVGILADVPGSTLTRLDEFRSGIGRLARRADVAALVWLLVFGAFANAAGMIASVVRWQDALRDRLGISQFAIVTLYYLLALVLAPLLLLAIASAGSRGWAAARRPIDLLAVRFAFAFVPLGFAMWLAHHGFHFLTSYATILPVTQRMLGDFAGIAALGEPAWQHACCVGVADWIIKFELLSLDVGLLGTLAVGYRIASDRTLFPRPLGVFAPWAVLAVGLFALGVWIVLEPMQMRGTLPTG